MVGDAFLDALVLFAVDILRFVLFVSLMADDDFSASSCTLPLVWARNRCRVEDSCV
jgi:hypothetical protein